LPHPKSNIHAQVSSPLYKTLYYLSSALWGSL
jgi:hypothetical protein